MPKSPEKFKNSSLEDKKEKSELGVTNSIQLELIKRSGIDGLAWIEKNRKKFRDLFDENKEQFTKLYQESPNELYALLEMILES